jgi:hypothetical protein
MNLEELEEELEKVLPAGFQIEKDKNGRIIIRTGLIQDEDGELVDFDSEDDDVDFDPDFESLDEDLDEDD